MKLRVIVPCYNEKDVLHQTIQQLIGILEKDSVAQVYEYDLLFIDDGSHDNTITILQEAANETQHLKYISCLLYTSPSPRD